MSAIACGAYGHFGGMTGGAVVQMFPCTALSTVRPRITASEESAGSVEFPPFKTSSLLRLGSLRNGKIFYGGK